MNQRTLGSTNLQVSEIGFGAWQLGNHDAWGGMDDATALRLVHAAIDGGVNLFDTAPNYAGTNSERLLGEALREKREGVVLVSKFGHPPDSEKDFSVGRFWKSLDDTLRRLRTDRLDVLVLHNPPEQMYGGADPLWEYLERAKEQGKVLHYGASLDFAREARACLDNTGSEVLEILFNIFHQDIRRAFPRIREGNAGTVVKVPLDSGWLTGRFEADSEFTDIRDRWSEAEKRRRAELVESLEWLTADGSKLAHKAIAYLLSYPEVTCVIPGIRTFEQLQDNLAAAECAVTEAERDRLEKLWEEITDNGENLLPW